MRFSFVGFLIIATVLSGCGNRDREVTLTRFNDAGEGPNEFTIVPGKPLQDPESYSSLPAPTPGGNNRTDATPLADSVAAFGGNPSALSGTGVSPRDGALVNHSRRFGVDAGIRQRLATEDVEVRRRRGRVNILNIGPNDDYTLAYRRQWLDSRAEAERLRKRGVSVPSAPPEPSRRRR